MEQQDGWPDHVQTLEQLVNAFVDHTLQRLAEPATLPVLRLLLAESPRLPPAMRDWHQRMLQLHAQTHTRLMQRAIDRGLLPAHPASARGVAKNRPVGSALDLTQGNREA